MTKFTVLPIFLIAELALIAVAFSFTSYAVYGISKRIALYEEYADYDDYYEAYAIFAVKLKGDLALFSLLLVGYIFRLVVTPFYLLKAKSTNHANSKLKQLKIFQIFLWIMFGWIFIFGLAAHVYYGVLAGKTLMGKVAAGLAMWVLSVVSSIAGLILCLQKLKSLKHKEIDQSSKNEDPISKEEDSIKNPQAIVSPQQYVNQLQMNSQPQIVHQYSQTPQFTQPADTQFGQSFQPLVHQQQPNSALIESTPTNSNSWTLYTGK